MFAGIRVPNASELLGNNRFKRLIPALKEIPPVRAEIPTLPVLTEIPARAMEARAAAMADCEYVPLRHISATIYHRMKTE